MRDAGIPSVVGGTMKAVRAGCRKDIKTSIGPCVRISGNYGGIGRENVSNNNLPTWALLAMWAATLVGGYFLTGEVWTRFGHK